MTALFNRRAGLTLAALAALGLAGTVAQAQVQTNVTAAPATFTSWTFNNINTAGSTTDTTVTPTPATAFGTGSADSLGMTNSYVGTKNTTASTDGSDVFSTSVAADTSSATDQGSSDPNQSGNIWRVRGNGKNADGSTSGNGWSSLAPANSQGAQFLTSTVGETNIGFSFDWEPTAQGVGDLQVQYTTNYAGDAATTWTNFGPAISAVTGPT